MRICSSIPADGFTNGRAPARLWIRWVVPLTSTMALSPWKATPIGPLGPVGSTVRDGINASGAGSRAVADRNRSGPTDLELTLESGSAALHPLDRDGVGAAQNDESLRTRRLRGKERRQKTAPVVQAFRTITRSSPVRWCGQAG
ncbi:MAG: hypothetical protein KY464_14740 [Gemmatimonadetes bacterium]|nr:hypothetical protein [Gemmatimonadota bacterium]